VPQRSYARPVTPPTRTVSGSAASAPAALTAGVPYARPPHHAGARAAGGGIARWERQARNVTIIRDDWDVPHVYGRSDADAVFGLLYVQAEDDLNRVEMNYLNAPHRLLLLAAAGEAAQVDS
jgi:acyl-homoserine lactone acylase PvdQ